MKEEDIEKIRKAVHRHDEVATSILEGVVNNYYGTDGAKNIKELCGYCEELLVEIGFLEDRLEYEKSNLD